MENVKSFLAIETSSTICGAALVKGAELLSLIEEPAHRKHAEILPSFVQKVLEKAETSLAECNAIAVSIGPGSFTGLRVGLGFAKGLAYAHDLPIIPVPTIAALAFGLKDEQPTKGIAYSHSTKVFYQKFDWENSIPIPKAKPEVDEFDAFKEKLLLEKPIFQWNCEALLPTDNTFLSGVPSAEHVGKLGAIKFDEWQVENPFELVPEYIAPFQVKTKV